MDAEQSGEGGSSEQRPRTWPKAGEGLFPSPAPTVGASGGNRRVRR